MSKSVRDTLRGKLIYKLMYAATNAGASAAARLSSIEEQECAAAEVGYICHLLDKYIKALEEWVPPSALEALQAEMTQYAQEE